MSTATGAVYSRRLGLHVHVTLMDGDLVQVRMSGLPHKGSAHEDAVPLLERIDEHLRTGEDDFRDVPVDLGVVGDFHRRVLDTLRGMVRPGRAVTYGELARLAGSPSASRAVGAAMARNPCPIVVPCHRVVPSDGKPGNYSGEGGWETKVKLLALERAPGFSAAQTTLPA